MVQMYCVLYMLGEAQYTLTNTDRTIDIHELRNSTYLNLSLSNRHTYLEQQKNRRKVGLKTASLETEIY